MKMIDLHKRLSKVSCNLGRIMEMVKDENIREELYEVKREVMKLMIRIEYEIWKEERKKHACNTL